MSKSLENSEIIEELEETVKELKEDLKNAREMINCLNGTVNSLMITRKPERDEELHKKMDRLVGNLEIQADLYRKIDELKEDVKTVKMENCTNFTTVQDISESILACTEEFSDKHDKFQQKFEKFDENYLSKMLELKTENDKLSQIVAEFRLVFVNFETRMRKMEENFAIWAENKELESVPKKVFGFLRDLELEQKSETNTEEKVVKEPELKCHYCKSVLPKSAIRSGDSVSIQCRYCRYESIVEAPKEGHKWVCILRCRVDHIQQVPVEIHEGNLAKCQMCGNYDKVEDMNYSMAVGIANDDEAA